MPYWSGSPSSKNNIGSNVQCATLQGDGLSDVAEAEVEVRAHLEYKIGSPRISSSAIFEEVFVNL